MRFDFNHEPAVWIGLIMSVLSAVAQGLNDGVEPTALIPVVVGILIRFFVYAPASVDDGDE